MLAARRVPNLVQILSTQGLLFDYKSKDLLEFLDVLRLMQAITKDDVQHLIVLYPLLERWSSRDDGKVTNECLTMNFSAVKLSGSSDRVDVERCSVFRLMMSLFTSLRAFILPLNEFVCSILKQPHACRAPWRWMNTTVESSLIGVRLDFDTPSRCQVCVTRDSAAI